MIMGWRLVEAVARTLSCAVVAVQVENVLIKVEPALIHVGPVVSFLSELHLYYGTHIS